MVFLNLNMEQAYKREGHAPFEHFVGFLTDQLKKQMVTLHMYIVIIIFFTDYQ